MRFRSAIVFLLVVISMNAKIYLHKLFIVHRTTMHLCCQILQYFSGLWANLLLRQPLLVQHYCNENNKGVMQQCILKQQKNPTCACIGSCRKNGIIIGYVCNPQAFHAEWSRCGQTQYYIISVWVDMHLEILTHLF